MTDDFFETLTVWFLLLRNRYNCYLHNHDLSSVLREALREPDPLQPVASIVEQSHPQPRHKKKLLL